MHPCKRVTSSSTNPNNNLIEVQHTLNDQVLDERLGHTNDRQTNTAKS